MKENSTIGKIWLLLKPYKAMLAGVFIALIITSSSVLSLGRGLQYLIDNGLKNGNAEILDQSLIILLVVAAVLAFASFFRSLLINILSETVVADLRKKIFQHLVYISPEYYETHKVSDIISRLTSDTSLLSGIISNIASFAIRNTIMLVGGIIMLLITSIKLALYVILMVPLVVIPIIYYGKKVRSLSRTAQEKISASTGNIEEVFGAIKTVQAYNMQEFETNKFYITIENALLSLVDKFKIRSFLVGLVILLVFVSITFVLWIGGHDVIIGQITPGKLSSFIFYAIVVAASFGGLSEVFSDLQRAYGATDRLFELLAVQSTVKDAIQPITSHERIENITFKDVCFAYPTRKELKSLNNVNFTINRGEKIAIVGPSGAGKTTIFQLLLRFYDIDEGEILINNNNIKNIKLSDLRDFFAIVPQNPVIFSASAYDNIAYGNCKTSVTDVQQAAKDAEIHDFIESLSQKFDTYLGEKGVRISGGQAQRIAIARAIISDPEILLLDEATSNLDSGNEQFVQLALERLMHGKTTLIIAHRIATVKTADKIIVLDDGNVIDIGKHEELMQRCKLYNQLASLQLNNF